MTETRPWHRFYGSVPVTLEYPEVTLYEALAETAARVPDAIAWDFFGKRSTYRELIAAVDRCADALAAEGLGAGDRFLISMPTSPQGVIAFYAAIRLGALPALIHPLSPAAEVTHYLDQTGATIALTLDAFHATLAKATPAKPLHNAGICSKQMGDEAERELAARVVDSAAGAAVSVAGRLSLGGLAALLARSRVVVGNDSGPLHLAAAVGARTVGIYWVGNLINGAPLSRTRHRPLASWRLECVECGRNTLTNACEHRSSFVADVPLEEVRGRALELYRAETEPEPFAVAAQM